MQRDDTDQDGKIGCRDYELNRHLTLLDEQSSQATKSANNILIPNTWIWLAALTVTAKLGEAL